MSDVISLLKILEDTVVDGPGFRLSIYCAGCNHHCPECHNPHSWDIHHGTQVSVESILQQVLQSDSDVTFSGGDPFYQADAFALLAQKIKAFSRKNIWCYTGFLFEQLRQKEENLALLRSIDVLVDGPYLSSQKKSGLLFRGSANQRLIDVPTSLKEGNVVLYEYNPFPIFK